MLLGGAVTYVLGSLSAGGLIDRFGRKRSTVLTALLSEILTVLYVLVPNVLGSLLLMLAGAWFFGMVASSANGLTLEQVPRLRGAMMSAVKIGSGFGTVAGGLALLYLGYGGLGGVLGAMGIVAALIFGLLAKDPTKSQWKRLFSGGAPSDPHTERRHELVVFTRGMEGIPFSVEE